MRSLVYDDDVRVVAAVVVVVGSTTQASANDRHKAKSRRMVRLVVFMLKICVYNSFVVILIRR